MRIIDKVFKENKSIWDKVYLSDWFDRFYDIYRIPFRFKLYIEKFFYYGKAGTKCVDFDASSIHDLIYAHMIRVSKFMNSDQTHLTWNDKPDTKGMRKLAEFLELSKRMSENEMKSYVNYDKVKAKYPEIQSVSLFDRDVDPSYKKDVHRAFKQDRKVVDFLTKRYYTLLEKEVPGFWD